jgi:hypothetical protein
MVHSMRMVHTPCAWCIDEPTVQSILLHNGVGPWCWTGLCSLLLLAVQQSWDARLAGSVLQARQAVTIPLAPPSVQSTCWPVTINRLQCGGVRYGSSKHSTHAHVVVLAGACLTCTCVLVPCYVCANHAPGMHWCAPVL